MKFILNQLFHAILVPPSGNRSYSSYALWWSWLALAGMIGWWLEPRIFP